MWFEVYEMTARTWVEMNVSGNGQKNNGRTNGNGRTKKKKLKDENNQQLSQDFAI